MTQPSSISERVKRLGAIRHTDNGAIELMGITGILLPNYSLAFLHEIMNSVLEEEQKKMILYYHGKTHSYFTFKMITEKYGYKEKIKDKIQLLRMNLGQSDMVGWGNYKLKRGSFTDNIFIIEGYSPFADEYKKLFGIQKKGVDLFMSGGFSAFIESLTGVEMFCVEKKCVAKGDKFCEHIIKPLSSWDTKDKDFIEQFVNVPPKNKILNKLKNIRILSKLR